MNTLDLMEPESAATHGNDVVRLPYGLVGFERVKSYSLLTKPEVSPFVWLQMLGEPKHAFLLLPPDLAVPDYKPDLDARDVAFLELENPADALVLNIVTFRDAGQPTINLKGPIVINRRTGVGKQVIPSNAAQYPVHHPLRLS
jgi:flagellar assembly factor FliW